MDKAIEVKMQHARSLIEKGENQAGLVLFKDLSHRFPEESQVWLNYALSLDRLAMETEATPNYLKALELGLNNNDQRVALICLASSYRNVKQINQAMKTIKTAIQKYPEDIAVNCFYGLVLLDAGRPDQAVKLLGETLIRETNPSRFNGFLEALQNKFHDLD